MKSRKEKIFRFLKANYTGWLFALPLALGLLIFTVYPVLSSLVYALYDYNMTNRLIFTGLGNFVEIFTEDPEFFRVALNTVLYAFINVPLMMCAGYVLAMMLNSKARGIGAYRVAFYLPCIIPAVAGGILWKDIFDSGGIFNRMLSAFGLGPYKFFNADNFEAIASVFLMNLWTAGGSMILWLAAFKNIPRELYESADIDGASGLTKIIRITIPMSTPMIFFNLVIMLIGALQYNGGMIFAPRGGRGNGNALYMYYVKIYLDTFKRSKIGYGSALSWVLLAFIAVITAVTFKTNKWVQYGEGGAL